jgi:CheY-like chemotaxis protein
MGLNLLLADDDHDDCIFFKAALGGIDQQLNLTVVNDGVELMEFLSSQTGPLPDVLFLDLNMPRKNGFECMNEIKSNEKLKTLPVIPPISETKINFES